METAEILTAASALLGTALTDPADLGGSGRSTVVRARRADGGTVVVKAHREHGGYAAEAAGLRFTDLGPRLLAADDGLRLLVMEDLGDAPNLADLLLGGDEAAARAALVEWAAGYGRLAAQSVGRESELGAGGAPWAEEETRKIPGLLAALDIAEPPGLAADLDAVAALGHDRFPVFSPGDICPDNHLLTPDGIRLIDFEGAGFHSVFVDASYTRTPFSTCWCVFRLPKTFSLEAERAYRNEVAAVYPELADDRVWRPGVRLGGALYVLAATAALLPDAMEADRPMHRKRRPIPSVRQVLRYRWDTTAGAFERAGELPALAAALRSLLAATEGWQVSDLPVYPAFSGGGGRQKEAK